MKLNFGLIWNSLPALGEGALMTLGITAVAVCIGIVLGLLVAFGRLSSHRWLRTSASLYVELLRGTPMLVQIYIMWFAVFPLLNLPDEPIAAGIAALGLNSSAYLAEIFRGGILSIDKGQHEAGFSLGLTQTQVMRYVILPQALVNAFPSLANEFITLIKDSSLVSVLAVAELTYRAGIIGARTFEQHTMYIAIGMVYLVLTYTASRLLARAEKRIRRE